MLDLAESALPLLSGALSALADAFAWAADKAATLLGWLSQIDEASIQQTMVDVGDMGYNAAAAYNAAGDENWRGGMTWVGEGGPELVRLPRGSQIYSSQESAQMAAAGGSDTGALERIMSENTAVLRGILAELGGMQIRGRMYG